MTEVLELIRSQADMFTAIRHDLHRHPELPFDEDRTSVLVARLLEIDRALVGEAEMVAQGEVLTGREDFAVMLEVLPGSFLLVGMTGETGGIPLHNPGYDFNDSNIPVGSAYWVMLAERFLSPAL